MYSISNDFREDIKEVLVDKEYAFITEDIDSIISLALVQEYNPNIEVISFINNYVGLYYNNTMKQYNDKTIGLDLTLFDSKVHSISNHVENVPYKSYSNGISCNEHITTNYGDKSVFSTSLMLWSALQKELPDSDLGKILLLSIDSTYLGWFNGNGKFKDNLRRYLTQYNLNSLIDVLEKYPKETFDKVVTKLIQPSIKLTVENNKLVFNHPTINYILSELGLSSVNLDNIEFNCFIPTTTKHTDINTFNYDVKLGHNKILTYARVYSKRVSYCYVDRKNLHKSTLVRDK